jgi:extradiol dioxygenase family protein
MALTPFHLSLVVPDLQAAKRFYCDVLGCSRAPDPGAWVDVLLFGHQLTLHQASAQRKAQALDHFGVVLDKVDWKALAQRLDDLDVTYVTPPHVQAVDGTDERGKLLLDDPAGNLLEFKYCAALSRIVAAVA